ncbi:MAG: hypothetical protein KatS3mg090_0160 [Patescibacteria group bacterium]|nr:MAG: hypothetical protein KatS3mg090_0160 [Patescibacteria group bacterium]
MLNFIKKISSNSSQNNNQNKNDDNSNTVVDQTKVTVTNQTTQTTPANVTQGDQTVIDAQTQNIGKNTADVSADVGSSDQVVQRLVQGQQVVETVGQPAVSLGQAQTQSEEKIDQQVSSSVPSESNDLDLKADVGANQPADNTAKQSDLSAVSGSQSSDQEQKKVDSVNQSQNKNDEMSKTEKIDFLTHLTQRSNKVMFTAQQKAKELGDENVDTQHLLFGLIKDPGIYSLLTEVGVQVQIVEAELARFLTAKNKPVKTTAIQPTPRVKKVLSDSLVIARKQGYEFISPEHILIAVYKEGDGVGARVLQKVGLDINKLEKKVLGQNKIEQKDNQDKSSGGFDLSQYTIDLTEKAAQGLLDPVVERSDIIERIIHILSRRRKNNPVLTGEAGVGKTAIVEGLAQRIVKKEVPDNLLDKKILQLDLMSVIAGASHRGEFEERMKQIIEQVSGSQGQIILFIDEIHNIVGAGAAGDSGLDASNFLKPALARGEIQVLGATTIDEYRKYIEKDAALERRFQPVFVPEPTVEQAVNMLKALKDKYEAYHKVKIPDSALETAVVLSKRYVGGRFLPDKAVDLIDEAAAAVRLPLISLPEEIKTLEQKLSLLNQELDEAKKSKNKVTAKNLMKKIQDTQDLLKQKQEEYAMAKANSNIEVTDEIIKRVISSWTGIPLSKISASETEKLLNLEQIIHERLIDQEGAVKSVSEAIRRSRAGLKSEKRPIGSFVFLGPTGVGKTELAKTLAEVLFGDELSLIRFDMTEYMQKHEVAKLLGAPPGYVGYEEGGKLTEAVRTKPYSVVLFDEIEKAHPDIFNILLQILDDGRLTDNKGRVISFKNTIVICTSNIGTKTIQKELLKEGLSEVEPERIIDVLQQDGDSYKVFKANKIYIKIKDSSWQKQSLSDFFSDKKITDSQLISFPHKIDTLTYTADKEVISSGDLLYTRDLKSKEYTTSSLKDYFKGFSIVSKTEHEPDFPVERWKTHYFDQTKEVITLRDMVWVRKLKEKTWTLMSLKDYFANETVVNSQDKLPTDYLDLHTRINNKEAVIVKEKVWLKEEDGWKSYLLSEFLGEYPWQKDKNELSKVEEDVYKRIKAKVMDELGQFFRPELINRFDEVIVFEPLKYEHMKEIVKLQLKDLEKRLSEQGFGFSYTQRAILAIVKLGFDPVFGARPLRRAIQINIENVLSTQIISGSLKPGDFIELDYENNKFVFNRIDPALIELEQTDYNISRQSFVCKNCGHSFETEVVENATIICSKCLAYGDKLEPVSQSKENTSKDSSVKTQKEESIENSDQQKTKLSNNETGLIDNDQDQSETQKQVNQNNKTQPDNNKATNQMSANGTADIDTGSLSVEDKLQNQEQTSENAESNQTVAVSK